MNQFFVDVYMYITWIHKRKTDLTFVKRSQADVIKGFVYVVVNFLFQLIFIFPLFWGMVMYANEFKTKEKQKLTEIKNWLQHIHYFQRYTEYF